MQEFPAAIEEVYAMPDIGPDDDAQEAQMLLQHQHRERQRRALEGAEDKARRLQQCQQKDRERQAAVTVEGKAAKLHLFDTIQQSVHCHYWDSLGCKSPLQLLRKFIM